MKRLYCPVTRAIQWRVIGMGGEDGRDIAGNAGYTGADDWD